MNDFYAITLDIGTNSVGYAVIDKNYNIIKIKGQKAWGVQLFDEAGSAEGRRMKRASRRRLDRRKLKLGWLQEIFKSEIDKIDGKFLTRMKYSSLFVEDKQALGKIGEKDSLFNCEINGKRFTDKEFYKHYPTIYHLRKELTEKPADDIRFLYLALHNIIKRRGHFLYEGDYGDNISITSSYNGALSMYKTLNEDNLFSLSQLTGDSEKKLIDIIKENKGIKETKQKLYQLLDASGKLDKKFVDVIVDGKGSTKDLFCNGEYKFSFGDENYESVQYSELSSLLTEDELTVLDRLNEVYSQIQLKKILGDNDYICDALVERYNLHKEQLKEFKYFIKRYYPSKKHEIFKNQLDGKCNFTNYAYYVSNLKMNGKKYVVGNGTSTKPTREDFYKYIKSILAKEPENIDEEFESCKSKILSLIENDNFLLRQRIKSNSVFPNKLYEKELRKILDVNSSKFAFLNEKDEGGLTNSQKIIEILKFRVPYFVGPIGSSPKAENNFGWATKQNGKLYPWTLDKIVDFDKAEEGFIKKMTSKCTYLRECDVLPKHSILYSSFRVLNELNKLKINGDDLQVALKQKIFDKLFKNNKKVTTKMLKNFLVSEGLLTEQEAKKVEISGIDKEFANDLSSYYLLSKILGDRFLVEHLDVVENIILFHTVISDKNRLESRIKRQYGDLLEDSQIKQIKALNFSGWGRLSREFLELKFVNTQTGEITDIISELYNTNQNLQEILYNKDYTLGEELEKRNKQTVKDLTYQDVEELYCSPAVKRGVWQSIKVVNGIISLMGRKPSRIFVEVTRHDEKKGEDGRKLSRKTNLLNQYHSKEFKDKVKDISLDLDNLIKELEGKEDASLRSEKLYLYFLQLGRCAYSGQPIDIVDLYNEHSYDVDHIIPQSIIKDDSIDNKVLVKSDYNKNKSDFYPISSKFDWADKQAGFWQTLVQLKLMSKEKYSRLVRKDALTDEELGGFIARALVETNQASKAVIELLKSVVSDPRDIVYSKAKYVSEFRNKFDIVKCREVNDLHHAKDAYLNAVVGNILFNRFTDDPRNFYKKDTNNKNITKNIKKLFENEIKSYKTGEVIWNGKTDIERIKQIVAKNDCQVSFMSFSNKNGAFYDETIYKSGKNDPNTKAKISLKGENNPLSNFEKYGGYNNLSTAYFCVIESDKEDKKGNIIGRKRTIETVPIYILRKYKNDTNKGNKIFDYIVRENNLKNAKVIIEKLNIKSLLLIDEGKYLLAGKTGDRYILHNANEWFIDPKDEKYIKAIVKYIDLKSQKKTDNLKEVDGKVVLSPKAKDGNVELALTVTDNKRVYENIINQLDKKIYKGLAFEGFNDTLKKGRERFAKLNVMEQAEVLYQIVKRVSTGSQTSDLQLIGGKGKAGTIKINKDITDKNIKLVIKSSTGLISKIIKL